MELRPRSSKSIRSIWKRKFLVEYYFKESTERHLAAKTKQLIPTLNQSILHEAGISQPFCSFLENLSSPNLAGAGSRRWNVVDLALTRCWFEPLRVGHVVVESSSGSRHVPRWIGWSSGQVGSLVLRFKNRGLSTGLGKLEQISVAAEWLPGVVWASLHCQSLIWRFGEKYQLTILLIALADSMRAWTFFLRNHFQRSRRSNLQENRQISIFCQEFEDQR